MSGAGGALCPAGPTALLLRARRFMKWPRTHSEPADVVSRACVESRQTPAFRLHEQVSDCASFQGAASC